VCVVTAECTDVTITPMKECVELHTPFSCWSTHGYPPPPYYYWTQFNTGVTKYVGNVSTPTYTLNDIGTQTLGCAAEYRHPYCPEFKAVCYANRTVDVFRRYK